VKAVSANHMIFYLFTLEERINKAPNDLNFNEASNIRLKYLETHRENILRPTRESKQLETSTRDVLASNPKTDSLELSPIECEMF
jgi:hypothetical protein